MPAVQKIACTNSAGFVMSFKVQTATGLMTPSTENYPIDQSRTIDVGAFGLADGQEIWPVVDAVLGKTNSADQHVTFANNGQTATYEVRGATLNYSIKLIGG